MEQSEYFQIGEFEYLNLYSQPRRDPPKSEEQCMEPEVGWKNRGLSNYSASLNVQELVS
jgi:hypothetical protein